MFMIGSRLVFWFAARTREFTVNGYDSGVVAAFSIKQPTMRASASVNFSDSSSVSDMRFSTNEDAQSDKSARVRRGASSAMTMMVSRSMAAALLQKKPSPQ